MELKDANFNNDYDGEEFTIKEAGFDLYGNIWTPSGGSPSFVYIFIHGLGAYLTFKKDFFYLILEKNGVVMECDHLGHGKSPGKRTSCTLSEVIDETVQVIKLAHEKYPDLPIVVHGHSFGGLTAVMTFLTRGDEVKDLVKCVIAEAPWISRCPQRQLNVVEHAGIKLLSYVMPSLRLGAGVELFSNDLDKRWVDIASTSPLYSHDLTPRLYMSVEEGQEQARTLIGNWPKQVPLLFLQGTDDALVDAKENDIWVKKLMTTEGVNVTYKQYEGAPHVLLKCPQRPVIVKDILDFIDSHIH